MTRKADHPIDARFLERWSPRAFSGEALPADALASMLEAARWAPSGSNVQPWRFLYALRGQEHWELFSGFPNERNRAWCTRAAALLVVLSNKASTTHSFDAGCAWGFLALQAAGMGWATHAMAGFDHDAVRRELKVPDDHAVEAMIAIGRRGSADLLPEGPLRQREQPSSRKPLGEFAAGGAFAW